MVPLPIVVLERAYLKGLGLQKIFCAHPADLDIQGPQKDLTPSHWRLASIHELPRAKDFSETQFPAFRVL
jgi:hypothetical protein